jgi:choline kinase
VQIAEPEAESNEDSQPKKQFSAGLAKRLSGRPPSFGATSSRSSLLSQNSAEALSGHNSNPSPLLETPQEEEDSAPSDHGHHRHHHHHRLEHASERFLAQIAEWLDNERVKKQKRKARKVYSKGRKTPPSAKEDAGASERLPTRHHRAYSIDSQSSDVSLDRLQRILDDNMNALGLNGTPHYSPHIGRWGMAEH